MIVLFTDFGLTGPYVGQIHAVLAQQAPAVPVIDLFHDVPNHDIRAGAYLLPAYARGFPPGTVFVCVVDPGVGSSRPAVLLRADDHFYIGPGNGLLNMAARRARSCDWREILWRPAGLSACFHGRDLFAPVAAMIALGLEPETGPWQPDDERAWPDNLAEILYVDHFGNLISGIRAAEVPRVARIRVKDDTLAYARTFADVAPGKAFWTENSSGLLEIAVNQGRADRLLGAGVGAPLAVLV